MNRYLVATWALLLLLPMVPVIIFYVIFGQENYFHVDDTTHGVLAAGPIGAYFGAVYLGWRIFEHFSRISVATSPVLKDVLGHWRLDASSAHGTHRTGSFNVINDRGVLRVSGDFFDESGTPAGDWDSSIAQLADNSLTFIYDLEDMRPGGLVRSRAITTLTLDPNDQKRMTGTWVVVGVADAFGTITCSKQ